jgi:hypothetical protein
MTEETTEDAIYYKVWVEIERFSDDNIVGLTQEGTIIPQPLGEFDTLASAASFVRSLPHYDKVANDLARATLPTEEELKELYDDKD